MSHTDTIIELLKDESFPAVVLIDGKWGSGKTHYIKNKLERALRSEFTSHKVHYLSLYGISNIDDFRDRLISLTISGNSKTAKFTKRASTILSSASQIGGFKGVEGILNGVSGAVKYTFYSKLDKRVLLLDDLERISDEKSIKDILGECLNLAETRNIKVIVIANEEKINCKDDVEKVFSDKVKFSYTCEEVALILKDEFTFLSSEYLFNEFVLQIKFIKSANIRVLKRALIRFEKLKKEIENCDNVKLKLALPKYLRQILTICYAKFEAGYSAEEIKASKAGSFSRLMARDNKQSTPTDIRLDRLNKLFSGGISHEYLVDLCCDGVYLFEDIITELRLPIEGSPLDKILNSFLIHQMSDEEYKQGITALIDIINNGEVLGVNKWYNVCDTYVHLVEKKYISGEKLSISEVLGLCEDRDINSFNSSKVASNHRRDNFYNTTIQKLYNKKISAIESHSEGKVILEFNTRFSSSWDSVKEEANDRLKFKPFIQKLGVDCFIEAIKKWPSSDISDFSAYLRERYNFENINDYFIPEHKTIKSTLPELAILISELKPGLQLGAIVELTEVLTNIETRLHGSKKSVVIEES